MDRRPHIALYGKVAIERRYCNDCKGLSLITDHQFNCCGKESPRDKPVLWKRMSDVPIGRKRPPRHIQRVILEEQGNKCFYCEREFGSIVYRWLKPIQLRINWDHISPYCYSYDNRGRNFAAACQVCNGIKSSHIAETVEELREHVQKRRDKKGYSDVPSMRRGVSTKTWEADLRLPEMLETPLVQGKLQASKTTKKKVG